MFRKGVEAAGSCELPETPERDNNPAETKLRIK
jgi:hypothetical protein